MPEKDEGRDTMHGDPTANENQYGDFDPLDDGPQRPLIGRIKTHSSVLLALQLLNNTVALGAVVLIVLGVQKLVEVLL